MTNANDTSTENSAQLAKHSDDSSSQLSEPSAPLPAASQALDQDSGGGLDVAAATHDAVDQASQASDAFIKRIVDGAHAAVDRLADAAGPAVDRWASVLANPSDKLSKLAGQAGDKKDEWVSEARDIIRENPVAAIATALAVGAIYVKLTSSTRRPYRDVDQE